MWGRLPVPGAEALIQIEVSTPCIACAMGHPPPHEQTVLATRTGRLTEVVVAVAEGVCCSMEARLLTGKVSQ